jgi:diguanylate cyclase (GGDEF)-like protein
MGSFEMDYDVLIADIDRTFSLTIVPLPEGGALISHVDITWRKSLERQLSHRATHDPVTGLPNRTLLTDRLTQALQRAARTGHRVAVMFCDLDQFKVINDTMGHVVGDRVVRTVARRLESACRTSDSVTRFGGDEFVIVAEDITSDDDARAVAERLREAATAPLEIDGVDLWFGMSLGVVTTDGDVRSSSRDSDDLLRDADTAMYRAKDLGRNRVVLFDSTMRDDVASRLEVSMALRHAVERDELRLEFQPEFSCADGRVVGVEALVRWQHPQRGLLGPNEFIEAAEESGTIIDIGAWVLDQACREAAAWSKIAGPGFSVAVNLSSEQLAEPGFYDRVADCLRRHSLDPARLVLELTESALVRDPESVARMLHRLSDLGVWISVDDFGTGYSSLAYLQRFPVDVLKIDRSFVTRMVETPKGTALVHGIVDLAHALGLLTVAEGVEDEEQRRAVARAGCDAYQGYVSAMPLPAHEVVELLHRQATADAVAG